MSLWYDLLRFRYQELRPSWTVGNLNKPLENLVNPWSQGEGLKFHLNYKKQTKLEGSIRIMSYAGSNSCQKDLSTEVQKDRDHRPFPLRKETRREFSVIFLFIYVLVDFLTSVDFN